MPARPILTKFFSEFTTKIYCRSFCRNKKIVQSVSASYTSAGTLPDIFCEIRNFFKSTEKSNFAGIFLRDIPAGIFKKNYINFTFKHLKQR